MRYFSLLLTLLSFSSCSVFKNKQVEKYEIERKVDTVVTLEGDSLSIEVSGDDTVKVATGKNLRLNVIKEIDSAFDKQALKLDKELRKSIEERLRAFNCQEKELRDQLFHMTKSYANQFDSLKRVNTSWRIKAKSLEQRLRIKMNEKVKGRKKTVESKSPWKSPFFIFGALILALLIVLLLLTRRRL